METALKDIGEVSQQFREDEEEEIESGGIGARFALKIGEIVSDF